LNGAAGLNSSLAALLGVTPDFFTGVGFPLSSFFFFFF
jgi:hypothetical protein